MQAAVDPHYKCIYVLLKGHWLNSSYLLSEQECGAMTRPGDLDPSSFWFNARQLSLLILMST